MPILYILLIFVLIAKEFIVLNAESLVLIAFVAFVLTLTFNLKESVTEFFSERAQQIHKDFYSKDVLYFESVKELRKQYAHYIQKFQSLHFFFSFIYELYPSLLTFMYNTFRLRLTALYNNCVSLFIRIESSVFANSLKVILDSCKTQFEIHILKVILAEQQKELQLITSSNLSGSEAYNRMPTKSFLNSVKLASPSANEFQGDFDDDENVIYEDYEAYAGLYKDPFTGAEYKPQDLPVVGDFDDFYQNEIKGELQHEISLEIQEEIDNDLNEFINQNLETEYIQNQIKK